MIYATVLNTDIINRPIEDILVNKQYLLLKQKKPTYTNEVNIEYPHKLPNKTQRLLSISINESNRVMIIWTGGIK